MNLLSAKKYLNIFKERLYESTSGKCFVPAVKLVIFMTQRPNMAVLSESEVRTNFRRILWHSVNKVLTAAGKWRCGWITTDVRQPWTNYVNNGNKHLIVGADVRSEYSNIRYLHLIIGKAQKFVSGDKYDFWGRTHVPAANTNLLYFTL